MGKVTGFIEIQRKKHPARDIAERLHDWNEVYLPYSDSAIKDQAARCMDCGIPFCHQGCPLGNLIPDWNDSRLSRSLEGRDAIGCTRPTTSPSSPVACARRRAKGRACWGSTRSR
ncbi:MAG: hypothetical protein QM736_22265 [Vicinamibacterales bacterium]